MQDEYTANAQTLKTQQNKHNRWTQQMQQTVRKQQDKWNAGAKKKRSLKNKKETLSTWLGEVAN
jgi:hypothetical protein